MTDSPGGAGAPVVPAPEPPAEASATHRTRPTSSDGGGGRTVWGEPLGRLIAVVIGLFAVAAVMVIPTALRIHGISPFDEGTHLDYAYQVSHGHIPARGSIIAPAIREEIACRGLALQPHAARPYCGIPDPSPKDFPAGAQDYNFGHPPLYYAITGVLARAANALDPGAHFVTFARLVGVLWLFAAMIVLYIALRRFSVRWQIAACGAALLALTPALYYQSGTVTNDAAAAVCGSLATLVLARITVEGKLGWKLPTLLAVLCAATKILNALPFLVVALLALVLALVDRRTDRARAIRLLFIAVGIVVGVLVVYQGWSTFQNHRGDPHWVNPIAGISSRPVKGLPFDELFSNSFTSVNFLSYAYLPPQFTNAWIAALLRIWGPLGIATTAILLAYHRRWSPGFMVGAAAAVGVLCYPLVVELQVLISNHTYFPVVLWRYGISFIPLIVASMAVVASEKPLKKTMYGFTGACLLIELYTVL